MPAPAADVLQRRRGAGRRQHLAPARVADAEQPFCINVPFVATLYLQTAQLLQCSEKSNGSVLAAFQPDFRAKPGISGQHHYYLFSLIITIIITY